MSLSSSISILMLILLSNIHVAHAALTATTANTIQGTAPGFTMVSGENKLGFTLQGTFYSESLGNIASNTVKIVDRELTFNDFIVKTLLPSDFNVATDYADSDGDEAHTTTPFTLGTTTYNWEDVTEIPIPSESYGNSIGCSGYKAPFTLTITTSDVQVHS